MGVNSPSLLNYTKRESPAHVRSSSGFIVYRCQFIYTYFIDREKPLIKKLRYARIPPLNTRHIALHAYVYMYTYLPLFYSVWRQNEN